MTIFDRLRYLDATNKQVFNAKDMVSFLTMPVSIPDIEVVSSNVMAYGYDNKSSVLKVIFSGGAEYRYLNISEKISTELDAAKSKGQLIAFIKRSSKAIQIDRLWYVLAEKKSSMIKAASPCFDCSKHTCSCAGCSPDNEFCGFNA